MEVIRPSVAVPATTASYSNHRAGKSGSPKHEPKRMPPTIEAGPRYSSRLHRYLEMMPSFLSGLRF